MLISGLPCVSTKIIHNIRPAEIDYIAEGAAALLRITLDSVAPLKNSKLEELPLGHIYKLGPSSRKYED